METVQYGRLGKTLAHQSPNAGRTVQGPAASDAAPKLISIQYLRAIAALMVVYLHMLEQAPVGFGRYLYPGHWFDSGRLKSGVDIFFVISGFIMLVTTRRSTPAEFAARRIIRIVPLYWILTLAMALAVAARPQLFPRTIINAEYLLKSLLFIPFSNPGFEGGLIPVLYPGWTMNFEMYFYVIFAFVLFAPPRYRVGLNGAAFLMLLVVRQVSQPIADHPLLAFYTSPQILEFWCGMIIGEFYLKGRVQSRGLLNGAALALGFFLLLFDWSLLPAPAGLWSDSTLVYLLPSALIVVSALAIDQGWTGSHHPFLLLLGDASYSIYLSHIFFLGAARAVWRVVSAAPAGVPGALAFAAGSMIFAILGGIVVHKTLERPILRVLQALYHRMFGRKGVTQSGEPGIPAIVAVSPGRSPTPPRK